MISFPNRTDVIVDGGDGERHVRELRGSRREREGKLSQERRAGWGGNPGLSRKTDAGTGIHSKKKPQSAAMCARECARLEWVSQPLWRRVPASLCPRGGRLPRASPPVQWGRAPLRRDCPPGRLCCCRPRDCGSLGMSSGPRPRA